MPSGRRPESGDISPRIAAAQLSAVFRVLDYEGRRRLLAGELTDEIVAALRRAAEASFAQVRDGLPRALTERRVTAGPSVLGLRA
jgi:hypothetical protein